MDNEKTRLDIKNQDVRKEGYRKIIADFLVSNGWESDLNALNHDFEYWAFYKDGCYNIDISTDEIVLIDDTGDFMHIPLSFQSTFTLLGALIYHRQIPMNFKQW